MLNDYKETIDDPVGKHTIEVHCKECKAVGHRTIHGCNETAACEEFNEFYPDETCGALQFTWLWLGPIPIPWFTQCRGTVTAKVRNRHAH